MIPAGRQPAVCCCCVCRRRSVKRCSGAAPAGLGGRSRARRWRASPWPRSWTWPPGFPGAHRALQTQGQGQSEAQGIWLTSCGVQAASEHHGSSDRRHVLRAGAGGLLAPRQPGRAAGCRRRLLPPHVGQSRCVACRFRLLTAVRSPIRRDETCRVGVCPRSALEAACG